MCLNRIGAGLRVCHEVDEEIPMSGPRIVYDVEVVGVSTKLFMGVVEGKVGVSTVYKFYACTR